MTSGYALSYDPCSRCKHKHSKEMCSMCELSYLRKSDKIIKDNIENISKIEDEVAESLPDFKFCEQKKPPLGLAPPGIVYDLRMREISEAILRYLDPERTIGKEDYGRIVKWAEELHEDALLMIKLLK